MMKTFLSFDGTRIAYHDQGTGPAVILLHGYGLDGLGQFGDLSYSLPILSNTRKAFQDAFGQAPPLPDPPAAGRPGLMAHLLAAGVRTIVPDMRGFGASGKPLDQAGYANSAMARDVLALADHLGLESIDVVGFSMGALTAARLLALDRRKVRSAVLAGIGDYILEGEILEFPPTFPIPPQIPRPLTHRSWAEEGARVLEGGEIVPGHLGSAHIIMARATESDPRVLVSVIRGAIAEMISPQALSGTPASVLLLNGKSDVANRKVSRLLEVIPQARTLPCDGDHYSSTFEPRFQEAVLQFLALEWHVEAHC